MQHLEKTGGRGLLKSPPSPLRLSPLPSTAGSPRTRARAGCDSSVAQQFPQGPLVGRAPRAPFSPLADTGAAPLAIHVPETPGSGSRLPPASAWGSHGNPPAAQRPVPAKPAAAPAAPRGQIHTPGRAASAASPFGLSTGAPIHIPAENAPLRAPQAGPPPVVRGSRACIPHTSAARKTSPGP